MSKTLSIEFDLGRGERLLWSGMPRQGLMLRQNDRVMIPFSLVWAGFVVFWESSVIIEHAPLWFAAWGIPFVCAGIYVVFGRFFYDAWRRAGTAYGLTTERVLISTRGFNTGASVTSFDLASLPTMSLTEQANGRGSIAFGQLAFEQSTFGRRNEPWSTTWGGIPSVPTFEFIPDAKAVYDQIRAARDAVHGAATA
jgi:hypothetical protein